MSEPQTIRLTLREALALLPAPSRLDWQTTECLQLPELIVDYEQAPPRFTHKPLAIWLTDSCLKDLRGV
ncbi:MAG TPA: hypothetical protein V6D03_05730, partial [Candidatus Caenarcaniphilales bacterium]